VGNRASELELIGAIRARKQPKWSSLRLGIGDDCALIRPKSGCEIAVTTDFSLENAHFWRKKHPPESVGHRCLARGLSDLAAIGARPVAAFLSLALPKELAQKAGLTGRRKSWAERFFDGLLALAGNMEIPLAGGDTAESPSGLVSADIVLLGEVKRGRALLRAGARVGDLIYVTGALGGAAAELMALERNPEKFAGLRSATTRHPHLYPEPRIAIGQKLAARGLATAAIDISDGLSTDLRHLCDESGLAAEIDVAAIPLHSMARLAGAAGWTTSAFDLALHGGEDYELLFTAAPEAKVPKKIDGVAIHLIGRMSRRKAGAPVMKLVVDRLTRELEPGGWEHFR
jgi:thiamine-monophosphate kinase